MQVVLKNMKSIVDTVCRIDFIAPISIPNQAVLFNLCTKRYILIKHLLYYLINESHFLKILRSGSGFTRFFFAETNFSHFTVLMY